MLRNRPMARFSRITCFIAVAVVAGLGLSFTYCAAAQAKRDGTVVSVDPTQGQMRVTSGQTFKVIGDTTTAKLGTLTAGDHIEFIVSDGREIAAVTIEKRNTLFDIPWLTRICVGLAIMSQ